MSIAEKVSAVETVFQLLEQDISRFKGQSRLNCLNGCGECCKKPDIEATILEFLPYALHLYRQNTAFKKLEQLKAHPGNICVIFDALPGRAGACTEYQHRGLICRLFGFSAVSNKEGRPVLATCRPIKSEQQVFYDKAVEDIKKGAAVPVMGDYYMRLYSIDIELAGKFYPINEALKRAIETVLSHYAYRDEAQD